MDRKKGGEGGGGREIEREGGGRDQTSKET